MRGRRRRRGSSPIIRDSYEAYLIPRLHLDDLRGDDFPQRGTSPLGGIHALRLPKQPLIRARCFPGSFPSMGLIRVLRTRRIDASLFSIEIYEITVGLFRRIAF